jgi:hypothetical protein
MATQAIYLNSTTPAPFPGFQNAKPQSDGGAPLASVSLGTPNTGGVSVKSASYTATATDCGMLLVFDSASDVTLTLPVAIPFSQWTVSVTNIGSGALTISPGALMLDGAGAVLVAQSQGLSVATDGTNYFSERGLGTASGGAGSSTHSESLTDGNSNFIFAAGDVVTVVGVPN